MQSDDPAVQSDVRIPPRERCVTHYLIENLADEIGDRTFAVFASDEPDWTYADLRSKTRRAAAALSALGVRQGDAVLVWLPNGPELLQIWLGANHIGAVYAPLNIAYRGRMLEHAITLSGATIIVTEASLASRLAEIDAPALRTVVSLDGGELDGLVCRVIDGVSFFDGAADVGATADLAVQPERLIEPWSHQSIIYTSGTTGPSKGVESTYLQLYLTATESVRPFTAEDRSLVHSPLFHITAMSSVMRALATGGSIAVMERFSTATFWRDVRELGATFAVMMGSVATFLLKQPVDEDERQTPLKSLLIAPMTSEGRALARRIGADFHTVFSMSETSRPLMSEMNPTKDGSCGRPRRGIEARIVDDNDCEAPPGVTGELILRSDTPWAIAPSYFGDAEATARAWRNGWFHTGDGFQIDADGDFHFVDRIKDAIRRRGENISSFEVEIEISAYETVKDCAAVAVRADDAEDEVLAIIETRDGAPLDPLQLLIFLADRMPHYMVPRYVRQVAMLPRTPTLRVQKHKLRAEGVTPDTWDREAEGVKVGRDGLVLPSAG